MKGFNKKRQHGITKQIYRFTQVKFLFAQIDLISRLESGKLESSNHFSENA